MLLNKIAALIFACLLVYSGENACRAETRFVSLRVNQANLRTGPGERFPIMWVYQERHYPLEVLDEFEFWRQVREIDGTIGWLHKNMLSNTRYALILEEDKLLAKPEAGAKTIAVVQKGTLGRLLKCPAGNAYCLLSFKVGQTEVEGWYLRQNIWGLHAREVID